MHTRREVLIGGAGVLLYPAWALGASDFWNQKDPPQWSEDERERMLTNSPWAHKATVSFDRDANGLNGGGAMPAGGPGGGPMGGGRGGLDMSGGGRGGAVLEGQGGEPPEGAASKLDVIVRWESAATIRAALADAAPAQSDAYVISLAGMPAIGAEGRGGMLTDMAGPSPGENSAAGSDAPGAVDRFQQTTQLETKGHPPLHPASLDRRDSKPARILFYFDKAELPITASSNEVTFTMRLGAGLLRARFTTKEMIYRGQLCL